MPEASAVQMMENVTQAHRARVPSRFCGPPGSGNGGYTVGLLAKHLAPEAEVTLKRPIPVDRNIEIVATHERVTLIDRDVEVASARRARLDLDVPDSVSFSTAAKAQANFAGYRAHPFPGCFVCGTGRLRGDGMCLFTGPIDEGIVASPWIPEDGYVASDGTIAPEIVGAALDCPGAWGFIDRYRIEGPVVLGRMTYRMERPIYPGRRYVVMGWAQGREGRKAFCGTAVYDAKGAVCAAALSTWFAL